VTSIAVIVPVLNEASRLPALLADLSARDVAEIIIVDGGSGDGSADLARRSGDERVRVLASPRGRARQMNAGAAAARSDVLLFLHADTQLPAAGVQLIRGALAAGARWGRFDVVIAPPSALLHLVQSAMNIRSALTGICTGDQAIFVLRELFREFGGYADLPLMEDIELSRRLKRIGRAARIRAPVLTSARRWQAHGTLRTILGMWRLRLLYRLGVPAERLAPDYSDVR
jgi:rSAM/selenodomain-associated transferase 2